MTDQVERGEPRRPRAKLVVSAWGHHCGSATGPSRRLNTVPSSSPRTSTRPTLVDVRTLSAARPSCSDDGHLQSDLLVRPRCPSSLRTCTDPARVTRSVPVYELPCQGVAVMRRKADGWLNATQILKVAGFDKPQRTRVLEREVQKGTHEKVQGGYGKYQGQSVSVWHCAWGG